MDTQGLDYGSECRHNCVKGKTVDVKESIKNTGKKQIQQAACVTYLKYGGLFEF